MTTQAVPLAGLQTISLSAITPNPLNPRKNFDKAALNELAESIKTHGVRQPILVRPKGKDKFEIVCGERRFRASKLAGKADVPAIVDPDLSDGQALEISILENLQRQDVHPLEEAMGYKALMDMSKDPAAAQTAEAIAAKVGKSIGYVYARLKLLALIPAGREAFLSGRITAGHAVLIARLTPKDQVKAVRGCFNMYADDKEFKDHDPQKITFKMLVEEDEGLLPEKALREWIQDNVNLRLKDVPWDLADDKLLPEAGACLTCQKRSSSNPALFAELAVKGEDTCFDAACFKSKRDAFVQLQVQTDKHLAKAGGKEPLVKLSEQTAYVKPKPEGQELYRANQWVPATRGSCPNVREGMLVRGENAGARKIVCIDPNCKVHKHANLSGRSEGHGGPSAQRIDHDLERYKRFKKEMQQKKRTAARAQLARQMVEHVGAKIPAEILRAAVPHLLDCGRDSQDLLWLIGLDPKAAKSTDHGKVIAKAKDIQLNQILVAGVLLDTLNQYGDDGKERAELLELSKALGLKTGAAILTAQDERISQARSCRGCGCTEETPCEYWDSGKHVRCSWKEDDLCSNPDCKKYAPPSKAKPSAKPEKKSKK